MQSKHIPFGLTLDGIVVDATEVLRGHSCNCVCPGCGNALSAKQGEKLAWHFAHANGSACDQGYESALHLALKRIISDGKSLLLPSCTVNASRTKAQFSQEEVIFQYEKNVFHIESNSEEFDLRHASEGFSITTEKHITFDRVMLEQGFDDIRPDIVGFIRSKKLFIEIAVTHFIDSEKLQKIRNRKISTIEVDLSKQHKQDWTWAKLISIVQNETSAKTWLYNAFAESQAENDLYAREIRVIPLLEEKNREEEAAQKKREAHYAELEKRKEYVRNHIEATHDIKIKWPNGLTYHIELCKKHVRLSAWHKTTFNKLPSQCEFVLKKFRGQLNHRYNQWEFLSSLELFYEMAEYVLENEGCKITYFKCPIQTEFTSIPDKIKKYIPRG